VALGIRLELEPTSVPEPRKRFGVRGLHARLRRRGAGASLARREQKKPASIKFFAAFLSTVRGDPARDFAEFASIDGEIELSEDGKRAIFTASQAGGAAAPITYVSPPADEREEAKRRTLEVVWDPENFQDMLDEDEKNLRLILPEEPEDARFLEVIGELDIGGDVESPRASADVLDVPLLLHFAEFRLFDGNGELLKNVRFEARLNGVVLSKGVSDGEGVALLSGLAGERKFELAWGISDDDDDPLHYRLDVTVFPRDAPTSVHLANLGYVGSDDESEDVRELQHAFGFRQSGSTADVAKFLKTWHDEGQILVEPQPENELPPPSGFPPGEQEDEVF
jgi:hypothetical protein